MVAVGKGGEEICYEWVSAHVAEDLALVSHVVDLLEFDNYMFAISHKIGV